jgi:16S rRNA (cytosine967-C5)-methyltransferase
MEVMAEIGAASAPADRVVAAYARARRYIGSKDRRDILGHVYAMLRARARLSWHLGIDLEQASPRHLLLAKLMLMDGWSLDRIAGSCDGGRYRPDPLTAGERAMLAPLEGRTLDEMPGAPDWVRFECPEWLLLRLKRALGQDWQAEMQALMEEAALDLRVNLLSASRDEVEAALAAQGHPAMPTPFSPIGLRLPHRLDLARLDLFNEGKCEVQDEGSQLIALLVDAQPGERIVDFCAGAGGKTLAMAAQMRNKGHIVAADTLAGRVERSAVRLKRAGVHNVERRALSSERDPWVKRHALSFDRVLVDAPCSGTGTWRRNPDQRWRLRAADLDRLAKLQRDILGSAARLVRPGGLLFYATCSVLPEENDQQGTNFLRDAPDFWAEALATAWKKVTGRDDGNGSLHLTPYRSGCDGFFLMAFRRSPFTVRKAQARDSAAIATLHEAGWRHAYQGIVPEAEIESMAPDRRIPVWQERIAKGKDVILVAERGGETVGFLHGGTPKPHEQILEGNLAGFDCEIYALHCRRDLHGQGLGRQLFVHAARTFARTGHKALFLWAFRDNAYRRFYEKAGGEIIGRGNEYGVPDIAYGWHDVGQIHVA